jgi:hypothetical protein
MPKRQLRERALRLAERGWPVFPLRPGMKTPALHGRNNCPRSGSCAQGHLGWEQRATTDRPVIERCWSHAAYNIGLATGRAGLVVVDLDTAEHGQALLDGWSIGGISSGADALAHLANQAGHGLPETYTVRTPTGGMHLYFLAPQGIKLRNTTSCLGPLIDTRAQGGYVVAAGSVAPAGRYELTDDHEPAPLPGWLLQALTPQPRETNSATRDIGTDRYSRYLRAALNREASRVTNAAPGTRNQALFIASCALGQLIAGGALAENDARTALEHAAEEHVTTGAYSTRQRDNTINSGFLAGHSRPRTLRKTGRSA